MKLLSVLLLPNLAMRDGVGILARSLRDGVCILARSLRDGADILARRLRDGAEIPEWCINSNPQSAGKYTYRCNSVQITLNTRMGVPPPNPSTLLLENSQTLPLFILGSYPNKRYAYS